jgi:Transglycosylase SLT domain/Sel1 repeat
MTRSGLVRCSFAPLAFAVCGLLLCDFARAQASTSESPVILALRTEARALEHGEGIAKDTALAARLYCQAARLGDAESQFSAGWIYANGRGVQRDDAVAAYFFGMAARQGHEHAQRMLRFVGEAAAEMPECLRENKPQHQIAQQQVAPGQGLTIEGDSSPDFLPVTAAQRKALELVNKLAPEYGISPRLAIAVIRVESNFDPLARSEKNAQGLMQLIPETAARFNVSKPFDPIQNIHGGLAYLRWLLAYFQGDVTLVAAAYNAGEGTVNRCRGIPPYPETRAYVKRIKEFFGRSEHPYDANVTDHSPVLSRIRAAMGF